MLGVEAPEAQVRLADRFGAGLAGAGPADVEDADARVVIDGPPGRADPETEVHVIKEQGKPLVDRPYLIEDRSPDEERRRHRLLDRDRGVRGELPRAVVCKPRTGQQPS